MRTFLVVVLLLVLPIFAFTDEIIIGDKDGYSEYPWCSVYPDYEMRYQALILQSEIGFMCEISMLGFQSCYPGYSLNVYDLFVYLCHTSRNSLSLCFETNYDGNEPMLVYLIDFRQMQAPGDSWANMPFDYNFIYDNDDNLLVEVIFHYATGAFYTYTSDTSSRRCGWAGNFDAEYMDYGYEWHNRFRLTVEEIFIGVQPVSLGELKSIYR